MTQPVIDHATFAELENAAGAEFIAELVGTFFEEAPKLLAELRLAHSESAAERFRLAAHSLKTNAQTFGAAALGEQARALELGGPSAPPAALDELAAAYAAAAAELEALRRG